MTALKTIARMRSDFPEKFGIPRQSSLVEGLVSTVIFEEAYRNPDALRGLEEFSHIWLIWGFSENQRTGWSPTVRPPRLGGNVRKGVFATRAPFRPNPLGLSCVEIDRIEIHPELGPLIRVLGADLMDGTPIYDIKPYIPYADSRPDALGGFASGPPESQLAVHFKEDVSALLSPDTEGTLRALLAQDPRPPYQRNPARVYGMAFQDWELKFSVDGEELTVLSITKASNS